MKKGPITMSQDTSAPSKLSEVLKTMIDKTEGSERVSLGDLFDALESRSYGPILLVPALIAIIPVVGGVPGVSILAGSLIILIAAQAAAGRSQPWLPGKLLSFSFPRKRLVRGYENVGPWIRRSERLVQRRIPALTETPFVRIIAACCVLLGILFYPLALIPFAVLVPGLGVCCLALGLTTRDGYLIVAGLTVFAFATGMTLCAL